MANKVDYKIGIIGGGFGGLGIGIRLKKENRDSFIIFERAEEVGGTWRDNTYPGCGCDIPSHLYSYSFELNPNWSRGYSKQPEILAYMIACKKKYALDAHIRYNATITKAVFHEQEGYWELTDQAGKVTLVENVIAAIGPFNVPNIPKFKGLESFEGASFHSSQWDHTVDLKNKRVAVIGTGASAVQVVPGIVSEVEHLSLFQRTAPWILPKDDFEVSSFSKKINRTFPFIQKLRRLGIYWFFEYSGRALFRENSTRKMIRKLAQDHLEKQVPDEVLRKKLTPNYEIGCKRRLPSDEFYPALMQKNVAVVCDSIQEITPKGIVDSKGVLHEVDVIIYATGFHVADFRGKNLEVIGRGGLNLFENWTEKVPEAYYGTAVSGFPGLLFVLGPNTGLGHNSQLHVMESQFNYIIGYLNELDKLPTAYLDVKPSAQKEFNDAIQTKLKGMVWSSGGCTSWYLKDSGHNSTLWPGYTVTYRWKTRKIIRNDFEVVKMG
ncbi:MAG: Cyclohexanone monooxygenase (EC [uncultured Aureispira sp.]|uniref:Cyclohexanone monooxygenase (EC) n=1 Tax=uncultured Aureispira sp. TaxID=1331704 RepID=A0A6S6U7S9_9BACT|nr:MAG: Cyclohexanone monooxygenase (EC [uncultured Aureispira sp.]